MKSFYLFIILISSLIFSFNVIANEKGTYISNFFKQNQAFHKEDRISQSVEKAISIELEKRLPKQLLERTDLTNNLSMSSETEKYTDEIVQSLINAYKEIYDDEIYHKRCRKGDKDEIYVIDIGRLESFAGRYSENNPIILHKLLLPILSDTNNWKRPTAYILTYLIGGTSDTAIENSNLRNKYMVFYRKLDEKYQEINKRYKLQPWGKKRKIIRPVDDLRGSIWICLQKTFSEMPLPELEKLLENEQNRYLIEILLFGVRKQPSDKAYEIFAKYYPKSVTHSSKSEIRGMIQAFHRTCMKYEKWNKRLKAAGYDKQKAEKQFKAEVEAIKQKLKSINYNNPKDILRLPELLHQAEDLAGEKPQSGMYPDRYLKPIKRNPVSECKEAYWQILQREPDEEKYKIEPEISVAFGEAYGKVMTKEDVPKVINYMNEARSLKLLMLIGNVLGKDPKVYKTAAVMGIVGGIRKRKDIIAKFYKNRDKIKDRFMRKGFIEMAEKNGVTN